MNCSAMYGEILKLLRKDGEITYDINSQMVSHIQLWSAMYENRTAPKGKKSANLPVQIASETARLVTLEFKSEVTGSKAADYLNAGYCAWFNRKIKEAAQLFGKAKALLPDKPLSDKFKEDTALLDTYQIDLTDRAIMAGM